MRSSTILALAMSALAVARPSSWLDERDNAKVPALNLANLGDYIPKSNISGRIATHDGLNMYTSAPTCPPNRKALVIVSDADGIQSPALQGLADGFARSGFFVVAPDLTGGAPWLLNYEGVSSGTAAPGKLNEADRRLNDTLTSFAAKYPVSVTDEIVIKAINYLGGLNYTRGSVGIAGYGHGGRLAIRASDRVGAVFAADPAFVTDEEVKANDTPLAIAFAALDPTLTPARRNDIAKAVDGGNCPYSVVNHGATQRAFALRTDLTSKIEVVAKQQAFLQALHWFSAWLQ